jgi:hypothetical protein
MKQPCESKHSPGKNTPLQPTKAGYVAREGKMAQRCHSGSNGDVRRVIAGQKDVAVFSIA